MGKGPINVNETKTLQRAREAIRRGDKATGQRLLAQVIKANPSNKAAWLWLFAIVDDADQERDCLEWVLRIDPENQAARQRLASARAKKSARMALLWGAGGVALVTLLGWFALYVLGSAGSTTPDSARIAERVASYRDRGDTLDGWCADLARGTYGERAGTTDWTAKRKSPQDVWVIECQVDVSTAWGAFTRRRTVLVFVYDAASDLVRVQRVLGKTVTKSQRLLALEKDIEETLGQPIYGSR